MKDDDQPSALRSCGNVATVAMHELSRGLIVGIFASAIYIDMKSWEVAFQAMRDLERGKQLSAPIKYFPIVERAVRRTAAIGVGWGLYCTIEAALAECRGREHFAHTAVAAAAGTASGLALQAPRPRQFALPVICAGWGAGLVKYVRDEMWVLDYRVQLSSRGNEG